MKRVTAEKVYALLKKLQEKYPRLDVHRNGGQYGNYWYAVVAREPGSGCYSGSNLSDYLTTREMYYWLQGFQGNDQLTEKIQ